MADARTAHFSQNRSMAYTPEQIRAAYAARESFAHQHAPLGHLTEAEIEVILNRTAKALGVHPVVVLGAVNG